MLYPMVALSTLATVIASQAMISGVFSLTRQAVQLGYCPRVRIVHTSSDMEGQIYIPEINTMMMWACIGLVLAFRESSRLAGAYGIAVTATMAITSGLYFVVLTRTWKWPLLKALPPGRALPGLRPGVLRLQPAQGHGRRLVPPWPWPPSSWPA